MVNYSVVEHGMVQYSINRRIPTAVFLSPVFGGHQKSCFFVLQDFGGVYVVFGAPFGVAAVQVTSGTPACVLTPTTKEAAFAYCNNISSALLAKDTQGAWGRRRRAAREVSI